MITFSPNSWGGVRESACRQPAGAPDGSGGEFTSCHDPLVFRGVKAKGSKYLAGQDKHGTFWSVRAKHARHYMRDNVTHALVPGGGLWVGRAPREKMTHPDKLAPSFVLIDPADVRDKAFIPAQAAWMSRHGIQSMRRRARKEVSGAADETRRKWRARKSR